MKQVSELSQHQKIFTLMVRAKPEQWFYPYDFMKRDLGDLFVGYEASARFSELAKEYPEIIESERDGKYFRRRIMFDRLLPNLHLLSKDLRYVVHRAGLTKGQKAQAEPAMPKPKPQGTIHNATYTGNKYTHSKTLHVGSTYSIFVSKLIVGKPIEVSVKGLMLSYENMAAFSRDWTIQ